MSFVTRDDHVRIRCKRTLQYHLVSGIWGSAASALGWKDQDRCFCQRFCPSRASAVRILPAEQFHGFMILGKQRRTNHSFTSPLGPRRQTIKRRTAPKGRARHDVRVENDPQDQLPLRTRSIARPTAISSRCDCSGSSRPDSSNDRMRPGVNARRLRSTMRPLKEPTSNSSPGRIRACSRRASGMTI